LRLFFQRPFGSFRIAFHGLLNGLRQLGILGRLRFVHHQCHQFFGRQLIQRSDARFRFQHVRTLLQALLILLQLFRKGLFDFGKLLVFALQPRNLLPFQRVNGLLQLGRGLDELLIGLGQLQDVGAQRFVGETKVFIFLSQPVRQGRRGVHGRCRFRRQRGPLRALFGGRLQESVPFVLLPLSNFQQFSLLLVFDPSQLKLQLGNDQVPLRQEATTVLLQNGRVPRLAGANSRQNAPPQPLHRRGGLAVSLGEFLLHLFALPSFLGRPPGGEALAAQFLQCGAERGLIVPLQQEATHLSLQEGHGSIEAFEQNGTELKGEFGRVFGFEGRLFVAQ